MWSDIETLQRIAKLVPYIFIIAGFLVAVSGQFVKTKIEDRVKTLQRQADAGRTLSPDQRAVLSAALDRLDKAEIEFECPVDDREAATFANELLELFRSAGWTITTFARAQYPNGVNPKGLEIGIRSTELEPLGRSVVDALRGVRLIARVSYGHDAQRYPLIFLVGSKP